MPYIKEELRKKLEPLIKSIQEQLWKITIGEVNYLITKICVWYLNHNGINYENINALVGVLECAKQELYRKIASPYEDKKEFENGGVY